MAASKTLSAAPGIITRVTPFGVLDAATPFDDPAVKALMQIALDTAKSGGASYADVRVAARRQQNVSTRDRIVQGVNDTELLDWAFVPLLTVHGGLPQRAC